MTTNIVLATNSLDAFSLTLSSILYYSSLMVINLRGHNSTTPNYIESVL